MSKLRLRLIGAFQLISAGGNDIFVPTRKAKGLLAYIGFYLNQPHERAKLASLFWEDSEESQARDSLRQALALLRKAIPLPAEQWIITNGEVVTFNASQVDVDVHRFVSTARGERPGDLQEAAELYRGEFLEGFEIRSTSFESWLSATRQMLNEKALTCLSKLLSTYVRDNQIDHGIAIATKILQIDPLREEVHRQLMDLYRLQGRYAAALQQYEACARTLAKELDVQPEHATKALHKKIRDQRNRVAEKGGEDKSPGASAYPSSLNLRAKESSAAEYDQRHIAVLSLDLLGLDDQLESLGPERLLVAAEAFLKKACEIVASFGGITGRFSGNGFPAFFGYPRADEYSAERAVRAGLALVREIEQQYDAGDLHFRARAGVDASPVLVSNFGIDTYEPVPVFIGDAPKKAALLQSLAAPDTVLITGKLRRALGTLFEYEAFTPEIGLPSENLNPWRVLREDPNADRFAALRGMTTLRLVGRECELKRLLEDWCIAKDGAGRMVLVMGEAGIGKSRLARGLQDRISDEPHLTLRYQCSPFYSNTPLHPVIHQIERAAGFQPDESRPLKLLKLSRLLREQDSPEATHIIPLYAGLLGIAGQPQGSTPSQQLRKTLAAILSHIEALSRVRPLLMIIEDLHWADATSRELLDLIAERIRNLSIMVVVTARPGLDAPWCGLDNANLVELTGLSPSEAEEIVHDLGGADPLPSSAVAHILTKADGIPLFIEELSKVAIEMRGHQSFCGPPRSLPIPSTLEDSLLARLDSQGAGKEFAQIGAVIGREFSIELISQIAETPRRIIEEELSKLAGSGLIFRSGPGFAFKHALLQDAAYKSLTVRRRKYFHRCVAAALLPSSADNKPELLAHHYSAARMPAEALPFWLKAGTQAAERSAYSEAIGHIDRGLQLLESAPDMPDDERHGWKIRLLVLKGPCVMSLYGYGAEESREVCERALGLIGISTPISAKIQILGGLWGVHFHRGEIKEALAIAENLAGLSLSFGAGIDAANCMMGHTLCAGGDFLSARRYFQEVVNSPRRDRSPAPGFFAVDESVLALTYLSRLLWTLGYLEQSGTAMTKAVEAARLSSNSASIAIALLGQISMESHSVPLERVIAQAEEGMAFCAKHELWLFEHWFRFHHGVLITKQGEIAKGIEIMESAIAAAEKKNSRHLRPLQLACLGLAYAMQNQPEKALAWFDCALELAERTGERQSEARIRRMRGELLLHLGRPADACRELQEALRVASTQSARLEELRAAMTLTRHSLVLDDGTEGRDALSRAYTSFTEGYGFADLKEARALLGPGQRL